MQFVTMLNNVRVLLMKTRDIDVRKKLHNTISIEFLDDDDAVVIDELGLCQGEARIDIAVVNGSIHGYEIKSDSDTLERLPKQMNIYNKVMDTITIVAGKCHVGKIIDLVPEWWGILQAEKVSKDVINLISIREPKNNTQINPYCLAQLLWKEEALDLLTMLGLEKGYLSKPRKIIWNKLANSVPLHQLQLFVRQQLKIRKNHRVVQ